MTTQKTEIERAKARMLKAARSLKRLQKSMEADDELNELLPALEDEFDRRIHKGELPDDIAYELSREVLRVS